VQQLDVVPPPPKTREIPVQKILLGGEDDLRTKQYSYITGDLLRPSTCASSGPAHNLANRRTKRLGPISNLRRAVFDPALCAVQPARAITVPVTCTGHCAAGVIPASRASPSSASSIISRAAKRTSSEVPPSQAKTPSPGPGPGMFPRVGRGRLSGKCSPKLDGEGQASDAVAAGCGWGGPPRVDAQSPAPLARLPDRPRSSSITTTFCQPSACARVAKPYCIGDVGSRDCQAAGPLSIA
jgi:hypothetical protein